ncbi:SOS response-associated peptidase [bacterium]|nr:SOS response-associated peptidase [Mariniblastus sp.]MDA7926318.1 SOS response-associated peptidase [Mariniblastus sp.]MDB4368156.1 SOS response-associated peptidase [Mariniblastus sp.]MDB4368757.1 SOS response-associated peptidase [bacterium]
MCGRLTLRTPTSALTALFSGLQFSQRAFRFNICPTHPLLCVRQGNSLQLESVDLRWGLIPAWTKEPKIGTGLINARSETAASKPSFRDAFQHRRCLIIADGFFEWKKTGAAKQPFYICRKDQQPFCLAGLWESWQDENHPTQAPIQTCTVLTTSANDFMAPMHDRMPVFLEPDQFERWLDKSNPLAEPTQPMMSPLRTDSLQAYPVSTLVNRPNNDSKECIARSNEPIQQNLF